MPARTPPPPPRTDDVRVVLVGTILWGAGFVALLPFVPALRDSGRLWWLGTCVAGFLLGLVGLAYLRRREAAIARDEQRARATD